MIVTFTEPLLKLYILYLESKSGLKFMNLKFLFFYGTVLQINNYYILFDYVLKVNRKFESKLLNSTERISTTNSIPT